MNTSSDTGSQELAGSPTGRFCPTCRSPMVYTGAMRASASGRSSEQRCSTCGLTAWKRSLVGRDTPAAARP